jgi:hypothetical protein
MRGVALAGRRATQIAALALYLKGCAAAGSDFRVVSER